MKNKKIFFFFILFSFFITGKNANASVIFDNFNAGVHTATILGSFGVWGNSMSFISSTTVKVDTVKLYVQVSTTTLPRERIRIGIYRNATSSNLNAPIFFSSYQDIVATTSAMTLQTFSFPQVELIHGVNYMFYIQSETVSNSEPHSFSGVYVSNNARLFTYEEPFFGDVPQLQGQANGYELLIILENNGISTDNFITMATPCKADSRTLPNVKCQSLYASSTFLVSGAVTLVEPAKVELYFRDIDGTLKDSISLIYDHAGTYIYDQMFVWSMSKESYKISACITAIDGSAYLDNGFCVTSLWGNGAIPFDPTDDWPNENGNFGTSTKETIWTKEGCNDLKITDVFKGMKCAMIWAFSPEDKAYEDFRSTKDMLLMIYPLGYGTIIFKDITNAFSTTSTKSFDKTIEVGKYFGRHGGTTTISMEHLLSKTSFAFPVVRLVDTFLWLVFGGWLLMFTLYRKL